MRKAAGTDSSARAFADAAGGIVLRAVAGAEPAVIFALVGERDAAEMGADADHDQPLLVAGFDAFGIRLRIRQARDIDVLASAISLAVRWKMKIGLRAPEHLDDLAVGDRRQVDLDRRARAMVEASGFICAISGTRAAAAPTAPTAPVAM